METRIRNQGLRRVLTKFWSWLGGEVADSQATGHAHEPGQPTQSSLRSSSSPADVSSNIGGTDVHPSNQSQSLRKKKAAPRLTLTVQEGDTLFNIADAVNVSVQALIQANKLKSQKIYIGQKLILPATATPPPARTQAKTSPLSPVQIKDQHPANKPKPVAGPDPRPRVQGTLKLDESTRQKHSAKPPAKSIAKPATPSTISIENFRQKQSGVQTPKAVEPEQHDTPPSVVSSPPTGKASPAPEQPSPPHRPQLSRPTEIPFERPNKPADKPAEKPKPGQSRSPSAPRKPQPNQELPAKKTSPSIPNPPPSLSETGQPTPSKPPIASAHSKPVRPTVPAKQRPQPEAPLRPENDLPAQEKARDEPTPSPTVPVPDTDQKGAKLTKSYLLGLTPPSPEKQAARKSVEHTKQFLKQVTKRHTKSFADSAGQVPVSEAKSATQPPDKPEPIPQFQDEAIQAIYIAYHLLGNAQALLTINRHLRHSWLNAVVIDIKNENGFLSYPSQVPLAASIGANRRLVLDMTKLVSAFKQENLYTIARIVSFKDSLLSNAQPELAVKQQNGVDQWKDRLGTAWVDPFQTDVWRYNIQLAREAASFGFDEVQFDSLRFPTFDLEGQPQFSQSLSAETRISAISGFLSMVKGELAPAKVKLSMTILGYATWRQDDALVGHNIERLAPYLDIITPALYPSSFANGIPNHPNPVQAMQEVIAQGSRHTVNRLQKVAPDCQVRPWLQDYPDDVFTGRSLTADDIQNQIKGAAQGRAAGYAFWNPQSDYLFEAYRQSKSIK